MTDPRLTAEGDTCEFTWEGFDGTPHACALRSHESPRHKCGCGLWAELVDDDDPTAVPITVRLDRWASILRNSDTPPDDAERMELSTLLTEAANQIASRSGSETPPPLTTRGDSAEVGAP